MGFPGDHFQHLDGATENKIPWPSAGSYGFKAIIQRTGCGIAPGDYLVVPTK
jgi:hypothetical protein